MRIIHVETLITAGAFPASGDWQKLESEIHAAIRCADWPPGSGSFTIYPECGKERGKGNGVEPIKANCMASLRRAGWELEAKLRLTGPGRRPGDMDAVMAVGDQKFCVEWETGNVSSSHRALNKMALGILKGALIGGVLIVPTRKLYYYLTDRVGNYEELSPYFPLYQAMSVPEGLLQVIAIEHDGISKTVPKIPKGTDGRALG